MQSLPTDNLISWRNSILVSMVSVLALFLWEGNVGLGLGDEGFLWYGAQRVMLGEVPIRDFQSYDPGRYYWSAAIMGLLGSNGIIALRISIAILQFLALFVALRLISRTTKELNTYYLIATVPLILVWMRPYFKLYDITISIFLLSALTELVKKSSSRNHFLAGLSIGFAAVFGRNHALYGAFGCIGILTWLNLGYWKWKKHSSLLNELLLCAVGAIVGFAPVILMMLTIPNFFESFLDSILFLFEVKATNLFIGIPLPWHIDGLSMAEAGRKVLFSLIFPLIFISSLGSIVWLFYKRDRLKTIPALLVAAPFLTLPYFHHAFSRADIDHLAPSIFPFLIGGLGLLAQFQSRIKALLIAIFSIASFWVMLDAHRGWKYLISDSWKPIKISENELWVAPELANTIKTIEEIAIRYAPNNESFVVVPYWPGAYALLQRKSPMWETYILFKRSSSFEMEEIQRIKAAEPKFILIQNKSFGDSSLLFKNNRPLIYEYIETEFEKIESSPTAEFEMFIAREIN